MSDDARKPGQASGIHFNPLVEVVPPRTPRPVVKVIFIDARLQRKRPVLQKDLESIKINMIFFHETERKGENEEGDLKKNIVPRTPYSKS